MLSKTDSFRKRMDELRARVKKLEARIEELEAENKLLRELVYTMSGFYRGHSTGVTRMAPEKLELLETIEREEYAKDLSGERSVAFLTVRGFGSKKEKSDADEN